MTTLSSALPAGVRAPAGAWRLVAPLAALHAVMFVYDLQHPDRFMNADRTGERIAVIEGFGRALTAGEGASYYTQHGIVGDWLPQGLVHLAGGQYLLIALQVALMLASVLWLREIAVRVGLRERHASAAALVYALLPHTLVFPHQLATEALFVPLVILAFRLSIGPSGGLALGLATLIRPITVLWPFVMAAFHRGGKRIVFVAMAIAPLVVWMTCVYFSTGEFGMGRSGHDLGGNLYERMQRMGATLPEAERPARKPAGQTKATLGEYLAFAAAHPVVFVAHGARDVATLGVKSGIERLTLDYLNLFPEVRKSLQAANGGWRANVEKRGALATFTDMVRTQPGLISTSAAASLAFVAFMALALAGVFALRRNREALLLAAFVVYIFATAQAVDAAQSRHRAPAEFALCVLAVAGWASLVRRRAHGR